MNATPALDGHAAVAVLQRALADGTGEFRLLRLRKDLALAKETVAALEETIASRIVDVDEIRTAIIDLAGAAALRGWDYGTATITCSHEDCGLPSDHATDHRALKDLP